MRSSGWLLVVTIAPGIASIVGLMIGPGLWTARRARPVEERVQRQTPVEEIVPMPAPPASSG